MEGDKNFGNILFLFLGVGVFERKRQGTGDRRQKTGDRN